MAKVTKATQRAVQEIRHLGERQGFTSMTFAPIPTEYKAKMEAHLELHFRLWWDTWIEQQLAYLEGKRIQ